MPQIGGLRPTSWSSGGEKADCFFAAQGDATGRGRTFAVVQKIDTHGGKADSRGSD